MQLLMMRWWRKLRGLRLLPGRQWTPLNLIIWECTRCNLQGQISFQCHNIQVLWITRTYNFPNLVTPHLTCRIISCNKPILTKSQICCKTISSVVCRGLTSVAKDQPSWNLKPPQSLQVRVALHFEYNLNSLTYWLIYGTQLSSIVYSVDM